MKALAYIMTSRPDGHLASPIFERLERELEAVKERRAPVDRARKFLEDHTTNVTAKIDHQP